LEPHGSGNPQPLFLLPRVQMRGAQLLKEKHLKLGAQVRRPIHRRALVECG
jgi:single-stranded DNA-specific DHH superfamily exonuclease